ncbi:hypothetical protein P5X00_36800 [Paraburkholderia sp. A2RO-4L]|uniref:hypothetical protein n=1 Tax=Paraburkholderia sp. A2RO-4L TaxID=3028374 RepID=UPI003DA8724B
MAETPINLDEDFRPQPGKRRRDLDESMAEATREHASQPDEHHDKALEEMREFARTNTMAAQVLGGQDNAVMDAAPEASLSTQSAVQSAPQQTTQSAAEPEAAKVTAQMAEQSSQKATEEAVKQEAAVEAAAAKQSAPQAAPASPAAETASQSSGSSANLSSSKPSSLETTLSDIKDTGKRQKSLVLPGDPEIRRRLYDRLEAAGKLYYAGGVPQITLSRKQTLKELDKVLQEHGGQSAHVLTLKAERYGIGSFGSAMAGLKNKLGRSHEVDVVLVGKPADLAAKGSELVDVLRVLEEKKLVPEKSAEKVAQRIPTQSRGESDVVRLEADKNPGPLVIKAGNTLASLLDPVKEKVNTANREQLEKKELAKEHKAEKEYKDALSAKEKADQDKGAAPTEKVNEHSAKFAKELSTAFQDANLLHTQNGNKQVEAHALLERARNLKDPTIRELQTLPEGDRQKAIIQLAALIQKGDAKEFGNKLTTAMLDAHKADTSSIRDKVASFIKMEAERDPAFAAKAELILKDLVERKVLTEEQSKAISGQVAAEVEKAHKTEATAKPAETTQEQAGASKSEAHATASETTTQSTAATTEKAQPAAEAATGAATQDASTAESKSATAGTAETNEHGANSTDSLAAQSVAQPAAEKSSSADSTHAATHTSETAQASATAESKTAAAGASESKEHSATDSAAQAVQSGAESAANKASAAESAQLATHAATEASHGKSVEAGVSTASTAAAGPADQSLTLRDRLDAYTAGGEKLTAEKAASLTAELDALRTKPLSSLDGGKGDKPTQTLDNAEKLLKELESGRFGAELKAQAKDLAEPVAKWREQDGQRREAEGLGSGKSAAHSVGTGASTESATGQRAGESEKIAPTTIPGTSASHSASARESISSTAQATPEVSAPQLAKQASEQRYRETEAAGGKLSSLMANPAGSFTNRDKTWNEANIQRAASEVLRIDPQAAAEMSSSQRTRLAVYSAWLAESARDGKLPGFASEQGKEVANQLVSRAAALIRVMDDGSATPPDVQKSLDKANRLVAAMPQLEKSTSFSAEATQSHGNRPGIGQEAAKAVANDLVYSVYKAQSVSDSQVTHLLKSVPNLTPDAIKALPAADQAKTVAAMEHLVKKVNEGGLGEVAKLPESIRENLKATAETVTVLKDALSKNPAMDAALKEESNRLNGRAASGTVTQASPVKTPDAAQAPTPKTGGRGLDR